MAVGVCVSAKSPFCICCPYGYPNETGEAVREPKPDPVAGEADREIRGLVILEECLLSSTYGQLDEETEIGLDGLGLSADLTSARGSFRGLGSS